MIASVLSKKAAAGSERVLIDIPVGPTAKVRSAAAARSLAAGLVAVGQAIGLRVQVVETDGLQPVGRGIGPALEAMDVMAVLERRPDAPQDLRQRALLLAGMSLEMAGRAPAGGGLALATQTLDSGRALAKFLRICDAQGGLREPPRAAHSQPIVAASGGRVGSVDNRRLARAAKLAGAPQDPAAGAVIHVRLGETVSPGQPLFTLHAQTAGELAYALSYVARHPPIVQVDAAE
jgi:thymidine phosphorylase